MLIDFKENFQGGTRPNRFRIDGAFPTGGGFTDYHIRSATLPRVSSKTIAYDHFGRKYHYPGEREYATWSFQVLDDVGGNNNIWGYLQKWQNLINSHTNNKSVILPSQYKADNWRIQHLDLNANSRPLKEYRLYGCWPTAVAPLALNMNNPNTLNTYNVMIMFDYMEITNITSRNTGQ